MPLYYILMLVIMFFSGTFLILQGSLVRTILGIIIFGNAVNLVVFSFSGLKVGKLPIIEASKTSLSEGSTDPLVQALILTAIVIGFGFVAFILVFSIKAHEIFGGDQIDQEELS